MYNILHAWFCFEFTAKISQGAYEEVPYGLKGKSPLFRVSKILRGNGYALRDSPIVKWERIPLNNFVGS
jgi:hypothetical protein